MLDVKTINRNRTIKHFAHLTGTYNTLCEVSTTFKENGKYRLTKPQEHTFYMASVVPEVEKFCGEWYTEGRNPDWFPHPIFIATHLIHGRNDAIKECIEKYTPNAKALVVKTYQLMHEHNMFRKEKKEDENAQ